MIFHFPVFKPNPVIPSWREVLKGATHKTIKPTRFFSQENQTPSLSSLEEACSGLRLQLLKVSWWSVVEPAQSPPFRPFSMETLCKASPQIPSTINFKLPRLLSHFQTSVNGPIHSPPATFTSMYSGQNPPFFASAHLKIHHRKAAFLVKKSSRLNSKFWVRPSGENSGGPSWTSGNHTGLVILCSVVTVVLAVANRVLYKLALVPMKEYPFFLAQLTTFGYIFLRYWWIYSVW